MHTYLLSIAEEAGDNPNNANNASNTDYISEINNTQTDNAKHIDVIMPMYNLIEYNDNYSKTSGSLW